MTKTYGHTNAARENIRDTKNTCHRINCVNWRWGSGAKREKLKFQVNLSNSLTRTESKT